MKLSRSMRVFILLSFFLTVNCNNLINPTPDIEVSQNDVVIPNRTGVFDFGRVEVNDSLEIEYVIENLGNSKLQLRNEPFYLSGADSKFFSIVKRPQLLLKPTEKTSFSMKFAPTASKFCFAELIIYNSDKDKSPYVITIKGRGVITDISVRQDSTNIPSYTGIFDFGEIYLGNLSQNLTFTIENVGLLSLQLTGSPELIDLTGNDKTMFDLDQTNTVSTINPGSSTTFTICFIPNSIGEKTAKISIANSDKDENPYEFTIKGTCIDPEIQVLDSDGNNIENNVGVFNFPDNYQNNVMTETFTIKNLGTTNLQLTGSPIARLSGATSDAFTIIEHPSNTVLPSSETMFIVQFEPVAEMEYSATVTIANNDEDENPFIFTLNGIGYIPRFDFNGDGYDDVIVGAANDKFGRAYLFFGRKDCPPNLTSSQADIVFTSSSKAQYFGWDVSTAGDINNDGFDDILIGAVLADYNGLYSGAAFIYFGERNPPSEINVNDADVKFYGKDTGDRFGCSLSTVGDFNKDGIDDIIIGADSVDYNGDQTGSAYLYLGRTTWSEAMDYKDADIEIIGLRLNKSFGTSVSCAGDFNNDGFDDVIIGELDRAYIFFGKSSFKSQIFSTEASTVIYSNSSSEEFGIRVSNAGDFNNDGFDDIMVSAPQRVFQEEDSGCIYIYYGSSNPQHSINSNDANLVIYGEYGSQHFGLDIDHAGDVNNDGISDIITRNFRDSNIAENGSVYVFFGRSFSEDTLLLKDADITIAQKYTFGSVHAGLVSSIGDFNNDRIDDFIIGSPYLYSYGEAFIFLGRSNFSSQTSVLNADVTLQDDNNVGTCFGTSVGGGK